MKLKPTIRDIQTTTKVNQSNEQPTKTIPPHTEPQFPRTVKVPLTQPYQRSKPIFNHSLALPTDPKRSFFKVVNTSFTYRLCDILEVYIEARNSKNEIKASGGDYFWAWIYSKPLHASAAADQIVDHQNGSYTATFRLHWTGDTAIIVQLIHSSEAVAVLSYLRDNYSARCAYNGKFVSGNITRVVPCHVTTGMYLDNEPKVTVSKSISPSPPNVVDTHRLNSPNSSTYRSFCDFTDETTGFPWFCVKPEDVACDTFAWHAASKERKEPLFNSALSTAQRSVLKR